MLTIKSWYSYVISFSYHSLPYTEAALMEAQRLSNITPLAVAHKALRDTQLQGYSIPQVYIIGLLGSIKGIFIK